MISQTVDVPWPQSVFSRQVDVDFLFLDLNTCTRCVGTNENLETALDSVKQVLTPTGVRLNVNKLLIDSEEKAQSHRFVTSPTIRVNGRDIALETKESRCDACTDLCGCEEGTDCRVWIYQGEEYMEAPVPMIVEALLQEVYGRSQAELGTASLEYDDVPHNLQTFFAGQRQQTAVTPTACCSAEQQQSCCEPAEKSACCGQAPQTGSCGCQ
jgi:hypothetical protein